MKIKATALAASFVCLTPLAFAQNLTSIPYTWSSGDLENTATLSSSTPGVEAISVYTSVGTFTNTVTGSITSSSGDTMRVVAGGSVVGINNQGHVVASANSANAIEIAGTLGTLTNGSANNTAATIHSDNTEAIDLLRSSHLDTLDNWGTITAGDGQVALAIYESSVLNTLNNYGTIKNTGLYPSWGWAVYVDRWATLTNLNNQVGGVIWGSENSAIQNDNSIGTITNAGTIKTDATNAPAIVNNKSIGTILNSGTITSSGSTAISNTSAGTIDVFTNTGWLISAAGSANIVNAGTITTLNNAQRELTLAGQLPGTYNTILGNDAATYGTLVFSDGNGTLDHFGVASGTVRSQLYSGVLSGVTSVVDGTGVYDGLAYELSLHPDSTSVWDLLFPNYYSGPSVQDTQNALAQSAAALRTVFDQRASVVNNGLNYDCTVFATNGLCVSGGGRLATSHSITGNQANTLLVAAYQSGKNVRVGGFVDQNASDLNNPAIALSSAPTYGVFGVWNQNPDLMGYEVRVATNWSDQHITQTRQIVGTSEAGTGTADLNTQVISGMVSYAITLQDVQWTAAPYAGLRKTTVSRSAYTETSAVSAPLSYSRLRQDITTAVAGVRLSKQSGDRLAMTATLGIEQNLSVQVDGLDASGLAGLTRTEFGKKYTKTRPVASVGVSYAIAKNQRIGFSAVYRQEAFQSSASTTGMLTYQIGL